MIQVCDAIMGAGKTSSTISYINDNPMRRFIYITPYLDEAARVRRGCPRARFVEPSNKLGEYDFKKIQHTAKLIKDGRNVATTHQAFKWYTRDMLDDIRNQHYTLIIDENVDVLEPMDCHPDDLAMAVHEGYVKQFDDKYTIGDKPYSGDALRGLIGWLKSREIMRVQGEKGESLFFWLLPPDLITAFEDVFILTYLFDGQSLHHFLEIYELPYKYIGIEVSDDGVYRFVDSPGKMPDYVAHLDEKVHVEQSAKLNNIGDSFNALSMNWFESHPADVKQLKNNVYNYFANIHKDIPAGQRLWATFKSGFSKLKGKGYSSAFLTFNAKAVNAYRDRNCLAYASNIFMNVNEKTFYEAHGIKVDENAYALSILVQWIWRSSIRDGDDIYLYLPSRRMRALLTSWIEEVSKSV